MGAVTLNLHEMKENLLRKTSKRALGGQQFPLGAHIFI